MYKHKDNDKIVSIISVLKQHNTYFVNKVANENLNLDKKARRRSETILYYINVTQIE